MVYFSVSLISRYKESTLGNAFVNIFNEEEILPKEGKILKAPTANAASTAIKSGSFPTAIILIQTTAIKPDTQTPSIR